MALSTRFHTPNIKGLPEILRGKTMIILKLHFSILDGHQ